MLYLTKGKSVYCDIAGSGGLTINALTENLITGNALSRLVSLLNKAGD
jgi:hypothetical protein